MPDDAGSLPPEASEPVGTTAVVPASAALDEPAGDAHAGSTMTEDAPLLGTALGTTMTADELGLKGGEFQMLLEGAAGYDMPVPDGILGAE